jgi:predicted amidophosphoribosyltransferase
MPTVAELTAPYEGLMLSPRRGPDVCVDCLNFTRGFERCFACASIPAQLDAIVPISYSVAHEQLHHALAGYKRLEGLPAKRLTRDLAAILWRFIAAHETCVAAAAGAARFDVVTTVPSTDRERDDHHPLRAIVGELVGPTRGRHERLLRRSETKLVPRTFAPDLYLPTRSLSGERILLIDDTWTTGANAHSAAAALRSAGAGGVAAVVIGRHLNRAWHENDQRLQRIPRQFDWAHCALCAATAAGLQGARHQQAA